MSWQAMPTKAPVKFGAAGSGASSERMLASNCCGSQCQSLPRLRRDRRSRAARNQSRRAVPRVCRPEGDGRREGVGLRRVGQAGHHAQILAQGFVMRDVEIVEFGAAVVADQAGHLLKMLRLEFHDRGHAAAMRLLPPRDQRLAKQAADGFAADKAASCPGRAVRLKSSSGQGERSHWNSMAVADCRNPREPARAERCERQPGAGVSSGGSPWPSGVRSQPSAQTIVWIAVSRPRVQRPRLLSGRPQR